MEATPRFELGIAALQAAALPLGDVANYATIHNKLWWYPEPDLNRHGHNDRGILSPLCLPFHHPGTGILSQKDFGNYGAGERVRTVDPNLGKVMLYR